MTGVRSIEVAASVTEPDYQQLQAIATAGCVPLAALIRAAIRAFLRTRRRALVTTTTSARRSRTVAKSGY